MWKRANAVVNGAYSVVPGIYNFFRAALRGAGVLGEEEARRADQEQAVIECGLREMARHPAATYDASRQALEILDANPLFRYYFAGRGLMGAATGLGYFALPGDALRAIENGHDWINSVARGGVGGMPSGAR